MVMVFILIMYAVLYFVYIIYILTVYMIVDRKCPIQLLVKWALKEKTTTVKEQLMLTINDP